MFFISVALTALALSLVLSWTAVMLGLPESPYEFARTVILITAIVALPIAALAAKNDYQLRAYQCELEKLASTDPLTGVLNRRFFEKAANEELMRMARSGAGAAIAIFDLDRFKQFNDAHGHALGDAVLQDVSAIAHSELRGPFDKLGRWGGEEFVILLTNLTMEQADGVCERLRGRIADASLLHESKRLKVTASFGVAPLTCAHGLKAALEAADRQLYVAKAGGRDRVCSASLHDLAA